VQVDNLWRDCTPASIVEALPNLKQLNGLSVSKILEEGHENVKGNLRPRLPVVSKDSSLVERVMGAMWQYILTYRLADEEKLDDSPVW
jgi:tubulin--tyrosine ligase-like protein 12